MHHALQSEGSILWMVRPVEDPFVPEFTDEATQRGALNERRFAWGAAAGDLNLDGWDDLVQANGMVDDRLDARELNTRRHDYWYVNQKLMQSGPEIHTYADRWGDIRGRRHLPERGAPGVPEPGRGRAGHLRRRGRSSWASTRPTTPAGCLLADLDDDGDLDALITNQHGPLSLYRSTLRDGPNKPHFLGLSLTGTGATNPAAAGTRVTVKSGALSQTKELQLMAGFSAQADPRLLFGLGDEAPAEVEVTIAWHNGPTQTLRLAIDRYTSLPLP